MTETQEPKRPIVRVVATGGTIAGRADSPLATALYEPGLVPVEELTAAIPGVDTLAELEVEQAMNLPSSAITSSEMIQLLSHVNELLCSRQELTGVVITHGTDTLEESAFLAHLLLKSEKPVVFVGAMRPATALSADGPINLANAIRVAACPASRGMGTLVVMNDMIFSARDVTKTSTLRLSAFGAPDSGALGSIDGGQVSYYRRPLRRHTTDSEFHPASLAGLPRVDIIYSYMDADDDLVRAILSLGSQGIVLAGSGAGSIHPRAAMELRRAADAGIAVVRSSRVGGGRILASERYSGAVAADDFNPQRARLLLMVALAQGVPTGELQRVFDQY